MSIERRTLFQILAGVGSELMLSKPTPSQTHDHAAGTAAPEVANRRSVPSFFTQNQYEMLWQLCQLIIPPDRDTGGAIEAGVPQFIDLLTSENPEYQRQFSGGLVWIDTACSTRYGKSFLECGAEERKHVLDQIAFREPAAGNPSLAAAVEFFAHLRDITIDGFFTSRIGIDYLRFKGNSALTEFTGCPRPTD